MEDTIIATLEQAESDLSLLPKKKVVAGGCFDVLHPGHEAFLNACRKQGEYLIILLESDKKIKESKGNGRPHNSQEIRARNLTALKIIDYIILLPYLSKNKEYDEVISSLKPAIIATTFGDPYRFHKERQAKMVGAEVIDVIKRLPEHSTTKLLTHI